MTVVVVVLVVFVVSEHVSSSFLSICSVAMELEGRFLIIFLLLLYFRTVPK